MAAARGILALAAAVTTVALLSLHTPRRDNATTQCLAGAASGYAVSADATVVVVGVAESSHAAPVFRATVTALDGAGKFLALYSPESVAAVDGCGAAPCVAVVAAGHPGRKRVIQRRFNVSVPRARVLETAPTLRERSER